MNYNVQQHCIVLHSITSWLRISLKQLTAVFQWHIKVNLRYSLYFSVPLLLLLSLFFSYFNPFPLPQKNVKSFPSLTAHRAALISVSLALSQTPVFTLRDHRYGASVLRGVPVYVPVFFWYSLRLPTEG